MPGVVHAPFPNPYRNVWGIDGYERGERIDPVGVHKSELDEELCRRIRASFLLAGPLLARRGRAEMPPPGGDVIVRPSSKA